MIDALSSIIEYRSVETGKHIQRIGVFTRVLLEDVAHCYPEYLLDDRKIAIIFSASALHDIGKIAIPDAILNKPGRLTPDEYEIMKTHSVRGCEMLAGLDRMGDREYLQYAYNICRYHHERWDGRGYPDGLKGDNIPLCAQVVGIADCYDALTNDRVYKKALPPELTWEERLRAVKELGFDYLEISIDEKDERLDIRDDMRLFFARSLALADRAGVPRARHSRSGASGR